MCLDVQDVEATHNIAEALTDTASCGANAAKEHAAKKATAEWSGSSHCAIPVASEGAPRFRSWLTRGLVCSKAKSLFYAGSRSTSLCRCLLSRDQILLNYMIMKNFP